MSFNKDIEKMALSETEKEAAKQIGALLHGFSYVEAQTVLTAVRISLEQNAVIQTVDS
ncbi:hypothetical protein HMPREF1147_0114 [Selenomonas sp. FOBRC9]|uniref:hypothetical protein n=1 Tax=Selenomonas sp. FOBRC9 TaxID=936573 RepID=UPI00027A5D58|nr:hypothetical protein [Selenomonas sp. FOBRC9]EJP29051.1 hypothetical protein HMPREF1147_0114 [Selenomonas sp. FOBRC9]